MTNTIQKSKVQLGVEQERPKLDLRINWPITSR